MKYLNHICILFSCLLIGSCIQNSTVDKSTTQNADTLKDTLKPNGNPFDFAPTILFKQSYLWNEFDQLAKIPNNAICIKYKDFAGDSPFDIPFVGQAGSNIAAIIINGKKKIKIENREVFFRAKIPLEFGYNRVPIKVINKDKEESEFYIEISVDQN